MLVLHAFLVQSVLPTINTLQKGIHNQIKRYELMYNLGVYKFDIQLIEDFPCADKKELTKREAVWMAKEET